ncbi:zinc finger CCCH domain-containing protein 11A isoform X1 [Pangasianodon hypophthalmus]|uniref:zinc finger CCCH domain-containing protein 11A isoform X1 n=1 Tax=Pangasianodon hypophthalmus TaxID=310915 RepID=UPI002307210F|nr:zinc finger CCCH domain-containing protein 11A isoform X1 [Pangasianodon hypophthalmus]XP_034170169.2 zinc finger CCCH domain-containing protein 11A isoform X1 [Pangasianodon hypophthalmus]
MTSMSNKGDDCYFYYYSTCTKGDTCPFRHCEAAMGNETVCSLWQENRCFRNVCKFRHMDIKKNRKEIPCYWENQPGGCQKFHCAFHHEKPRFIDGLFVAADKGPVVRKEKEEETPQDDHVLSASANISNTTNPQLRGVIKVETQESVPSPTHPPVVINPVDDEDDEDVDQFSEEGEEASGVSPKKLLSSSKDESLNFGIKTLEEIRLGKALKASLNRPGPDEFTSTKRHSSGTGTEKETIQSVTQAAVVTTSESPALEDSGKRKITDRLGKRSDEDLLVEGGLRLKGSLAKRLGGFVDSTENKISMPPQKVKTLRPVRERLGITPDITAPKSPNSEPKSSGEIRIKTLEEIRQEKAAKSQMQCKSVRVEVPTNALNSTKKVNKPVTAPSVKTFSEILREKKLQETKVVPQQGSTEKTEGPANAGVIKLTAQAAEIRVKTLEEIRKEKAARMQAKTQDTTNDDAPSSSDAVPKRRILCIGKTGSAINIRSQKVHSSEKPDCIEESTVTNGKSDTSIQDVTVKSFEEIMREKRLRKQQEQAASTVEPEQAAQKPIPVLCEKKPPAVIRPGITNQANSSIQQGISHQASSPVPSVVPQRKSPEMQNKENSLTISPKKSKSSSSMAPPVQVSEMADSLGQHSQEPHWENTQAVTKMPPSKAAELKVRPKLNVKPSVMKPAAQVKPGPKRKAAGIHCSAVAAVKPLNAAPAPDVEPPCKRTQLSAPSCSLEVEARAQQVSPPAEQCSPEPLSVPQSPIIKTPTQTRPRRASLASARGTTPAGNSSTMDDFDDLLDEFTDDRLEDEIELDPGKGEDDLLLELSEMIDS